MNKNTGVISEQIHSSWPSSTQDCLLLTATSHQICLLPLPQAFVSVTKQKKLLQIHALCCCECLTQENTYQKGTEGVLKEK